MTELSLFLSWRCLLLGEFAPCLVGNVGCREVGKRKRGLGFSGDEILDLIACNK